jgi:hypothetical protein
MRPEPSPELYEKLMRHATAGRPRPKRSIPRAAFAMAAAAAVALSITGLSFAIAGKGNPIDAVRAVGLTGDGIGAAQNQYEDGFEGCTPGFWKNHAGSWAATGYSPSQTLGSVFTIPAEFSSVSGETLLEALSFSGGPTDLDAAKLLLHHAVAALLNASHPDVDYPLAPSDVISQTNAALASSDRDTMLALKDTFDSNNNLGCPLS